MKILLDKNQSFFKANLHCHSTYSDGSLTPLQLKEAYRARGYSIIAFTDHEHLVDHTYLNDGSFLAITACEMAIKEFPTESTLKNHGMKVCHLNFYAKDPHNTLTPCYSSVYDHFITDEVRDFLRYDGEYTRRYCAEGINAMIGEANRQGFLVAYNHPSWSLETAVDYQHYKNLFAVEIHNTSCLKMGHNDDEAAYDALLRAGNRLFCTACDDNHNATGDDFAHPDCDSFGGWVMVNAPHLNYTSVMEALEKGSFYASSGPEIFSLTQDGNQVHMETSPAVSIAMVTQGRRLPHVLGTPEAPVTSATFTLDPTDRYFRIRVQDATGKHAYTQAYFLD